MEFDPREWGRLAQGLAAVWAVLQLPRLAAIDTAAGLLGGLLGATFGVMFFGGLIRSAVLYTANLIRSVRDDE